MGKIAFVFAGQGAQCPGMGQELAESCGSAAAVFETVDRIRPGTSEQCFNGSVETLCETKNTQPCMFAVEMACAAALSANGIKADMTAGFSLGELAALTYAGTMDLETGFRAVSKRGELMQRAAEERETTMAAVLRLSNEDVEKVCGEFKEVYPVNYNCPGQVSVAGSALEMPDFMKAVKAAGGRAVPLKVNAGFHSPFMKAASEAFGEALASCEFRTPEIQVYSNYTGERYTENVRDLLSRQIASPVRWEKIVRNMISDGADTFVELGPGQTLCGFIRKISSDVKAFSVSDKAGLDAVLEEVR